MIKKEGGRKGGRVLTHMLHDSLHSIVSGPRSVCLGYLSGAQVLEEGVYERSTHHRASHVQITARYHSNRCSNM